MGRIIDQQRVEKFQRKAIKCSLSNQQVIDGISFETTPKSLIQHISIKQPFIVARVNGVLWDLTRPLEEDSSLEFLTFEHPDGKYVFWHSSAHVLGEALETFYGALLCAGPPVEQGFYYDSFMGERHLKNVTSEELPQIRAICTKYIKKKQVFERCTVSKTDLLELFKDNMFKLRILNEKISDEFTTVFKCGKLIDLCRGPHVEHTGVLAAIALTKNSSSYWQGNHNAESLQRIYGISFPTAGELRVSLKLQEEAAKRDHRKLGREQELFFFHELSPGSCFFMPKGTHIYNKLIDFIREYLCMGFTEVISPNIYNVKLWKTSGHYDNYSVRDALGRKHQISTIQLDFNLPERFNLKYVCADGMEAQPVMIHRAVLGSLERGNGIFLFNHPRPFWLSPNQVIIISVRPEIDEYAHSIQHQLTLAGFNSTVDDDPTSSFNKKIRNACKSACNFTIIVGDDEVKTKTVSLRTRNNVQINNKNLNEVIEKFNQLDISYSTSDNLEF
ncbi:hypothetical protein MXB_2636 [Myxobolus squamalis]|nr:hypothetical protein MXB_2636 [Myxobolus squamalis]